MEVKTPVSHSDIKGMEAKMPGNLKGMEKKKTKKTPVSPSDLKWMEAKTPVSHSDLKGVEAKTPVALKV